VNIKTGQTLASGIDKAEHAAEATKDAFGNISNKASAAPSLTNRPLFKDQQNSKPKRKQKKVPQWLDKR
jgi:hypothetical protein